MVNVIAQTILFHLNTFHPSRIPNGIKLNTANNAFMKATIVNNDWEKTAIKIHKNEIVIFVKGPEIAVFPTVSFVPEPASITAPGDISLKGRKIEIKVIKAPCIVNRNSAHKLKYCAENLCASSWRRNDNMKAIDRIAKFKRLVGMLRK